MYAEHFVSYIIISFYVVLYYSILYGMILYIGSWIAFWMPGLLVSAGPFGCLSGQLCLVFW